MRRMLLLSAALWFAAQAAPVYAQDGGVRDVIIPTSTVRVLPPGESASNTGGHVPNRFDAIEAGHRLVSAVDTIVKIPDEKGYFNDMHLQANVPTQVPNNPVPATLWGNIARWLGTIFGRCDQVEIVTPATQAAGSDISALFTRPTKLAAGRTAIVWPAVGANALSGATLSRNGNVLARAVLGGDGMWRISLPSGKALEPGNYDLLLTDTTGHVSPVRLVALAGAPPSDQRLLGRGVDFLDLIQLSTVDYGSWRLEAFNRLLGVDGTNAPLAQRGAMMLARGVAIPPYEEEDGPPATDHAGAGGSSP